MSAIEQLKELVNHLNEEEAAAILRLYYTIAKKYDEDLVDENGEVIVDDFYQTMIDNIDTDDPGLPADEVYRMLGIKE